MKRAAVFAHYDIDNIIDDYVIYYLKELKEIADELVFVSCNELSENEKSKLDGIADFVIAEKHDEYDFGSYKRGFVYLTSRLNDFDELIFANDSCYGPLYSLRQIFEEMEKDSRCDFWGITKNRFGAIKNKNSKYVSAIRPHIQSYFLLTGINNGSGIHQAIIILLQHLQDLLHTGILHVNVYFTFFILSVKRQTQTQDKKT